MSQTYVGVGLRRTVSERARYRCEYCLLHEDDTILGCEVDHIISEKHGGPTTSENLAYACASCNRNKGSDVGTILPPFNLGIFSRFFNPRTDVWTEHFRINTDDEATIEAITDIGRATERILEFNTTERFLERLALNAAGRYPPSPATE